MKTFLLFVFLFFGVLVSAQIEIESEPYSLQNPIDEYLSKSMERTINPEKSIEAALVEDEVDKDNGIPPRFGLKKDTYLNSKNSGTWIDLPNKDKLWVLNIKSPGAKSINLIYDAFHLPPGGMLHIYNSDKSHIIGAFTELNNKGTLDRPGKFATGLVYGDDITLEYYHPLSVKQLPIISVVGVIHGYRYIEVTGRFEENPNESGGYGGSGSCQVDINCAEGNNWQNEKRGIAMMLINSGQRWCTGSLVNNTSRDGTPYFLTADHCLDQDNLDAQGNTNASQYMFYWNYERPGCNNGGAQTADGATALRNTFGYSTASFGSWNHTTTKNEIRAGRPVILAGHTDKSCFLWWCGYQNGHAWVCEGYRSTFYCDIGVQTTHYYMNWGWGGTYNGYYAYNSWKPNGYDFKYNRRMIYNIKP